ncbi:MAG: hypothetical protein ABFR89_05575 [Actinomycetota bacterium]
MEQGDPLLDQTASPDVIGLLVPLPPELLYALSIGLAARLAASGTDLSEQELEMLVASSWRAITVGDAE